MRRNKWSDLERRHLANNPAREEAVRIEQIAARDERNAYALRELRMLVGLTQTEVATRLGVQQPQVSGLEGRADTALSTLSRYVEALGGNLRVTAVIAGAEYDLKFGEGEAVKEVDERLAPA